MIPAQTLSEPQQQRRQLVLCGGYGGCVGSYADEESVGLMNRLEGYEYCDNISEASLGSDLVANPMAEDESRTNSLNESGSSSKDVVQEEKDEGWLQLRIGGQDTTSREDSKQHQGHQILDQTPRGEAGGLIELDLLTRSSSSLHPRTFSSPIFPVPEFTALPRPFTNIPSSCPTSFSTSLLFQHQQLHGSSSNTTYNPPHHQEVNWAFRPMPYNVLAATSSSSSLMPLGTYFSRPLHQVYGRIDVAGPTSDFKVVDPPRRSHSGIWFMLQASQYHAKEPFLPQISRSYLKIKDGRITVRLLTKYLANKLRLDSESERATAPTFLDAADVRDNIWSPRDAITSLPHSSTIDHVMVLHYGRSA